MIRFRNPGTDFNTQIAIFKVLFKELSNKGGFYYEEMSSVIANNYMLSAYGYAGDGAIKRSNNSEKSKNSPNMNGKMYAETYRQLGWISSTGENSYPVDFTLLGVHVAKSSNPLLIFEQCLLGINNPQKIIKVFYKEKLRFFKTALNFMVDLGGIMYKHELCFGPMSCNDVNGNYDILLNEIKADRGEYLNLTSRYDNLCSKLGLSTCTPDNCTRFPISAMKACKWVDDIKSSDIYPPKKLTCLKLTNHGRNLIDQINTFYDLRLDEFYTYDKKTQNSLIRIGFYSMLQRSAVNIDNVKENLKKDMIVCHNILNGKELLFSPYQTLPLEVVNGALGFKQKITVRSKNEDNIIDNSSEILEIMGNKIYLTKNSNFDINKNDENLEEYIKFVLSKRKRNLDRAKLAKDIFEHQRFSKKEEFYPFISILFRTLGLNCIVSRGAQNGFRWDLIIIDNERSIPIEVKSPTEEVNLSIKGIRQALENKIILLSRNTFNTKEDTTSLAVGYNMPNKRSEVVELIKAIKKTYGIKIAVFDTYSLIKMSIDAILENKTIDFNDFCKLEGLVDVCTR